MKNWIETISLASALSDDPVWGEQAQAYLVAIENKPLVHKCDEVDLTRG